jgi:hypothetical protein
LTAGGVGQDLVSGLGPGERSFQASMKVLIAPVRSGTEVTGAADGLTGDHPEEDLDHV